MSNPTPKIIEGAIHAFLYPIKQRTKLLQPDQVPKRNFFDLARSRRSKRSFSALRSGDIDSLLWFAVKPIAIHVQDDGYVLSYRPSPSAGARHPIDVLVAKIYPSLSIAYYNPFEHTLCQLEVSENALKAFTDHVEKNIPIGQGTLLWMVAHSERTTAKYDFAESLIWRDAGALLQQLQLTATALNLNSCPIGTLANPFVQDLFVKEGAVLSAGGIIVGNL